MKDKRQGNDLKVAWSIFKKDGEPFRLEGLDVSLYLKNMFGRKELNDFVVTGNIIKWTFYGKDQKNSGKYSLEMVINEGEEGMITTDKCDFVNLVACSCKLQGGEDAPNVETESIELTSTLEYVAGGGSVVVDTELSETSENPIANAAVTHALSLKPNKDDIPSWIYPAVVIEPLSDSSAIIKAFNDNNLVNKLNTPILCLIKRERFDKDYTVSVLTVEDYTKEAGYRLTFALFGLKSDAKSEDMEAIYSPDVFTTQRVLSYLYNKTSGYVIPLGEGSVKDRRIDNLINTAITTENLDEKIEEATKEIADNIGDEFASKTDLNYKQDKLVSGTNIKTINGNSLLGKGNISVEQNVLIVHSISGVTYEVLDFHINRKGNGCIVFDSGRCYHLIGIHNDVGSFIFASIDTSENLLYLILNINYGWSRGVEQLLTTNYTTTVISQSTLLDVIPTVGAVYNALQEKQDTLKSGESIKTVNGESLLGSGNIVIEGGGESYDDTQLKAALSKKIEGKVVSTTEPTAEFPQVLYVPQTLTEEQKEQARENIGVNTKLTELSLEVSGLSEEMANKQDVYVAEYGVTTREQIKAAWEANKHIVCVYGNKLYNLTTYGDVYDIYFACVYYSVELLMLSVAGNWSRKTLYFERENNKVKTISESSTDTQYPSAKAVYDFVNTTLGTLINGEY